MGAAIYLTSAEGKSGKSAVAVGVLDALLGSFERVGVFRPLIRDAEAAASAQAPAPRDRVLEVLRARATADLSYDECIGTTYRALHEDPDRALTTIVTAYAAMQAACDAILIVGSDYTDVAVPTELATNARIAANLDAPVLLVVGGRLHSAEETLGQAPARSAAEIAQVVQVARAELHAGHASMLGAVVNRADPGASTEISQLVAAALDAESPVWVLPETLDLVAPSVSIVSAAVSGSLERGSAELLKLGVHNVVVAGMAMEHVLPRLREGSVVVVASDRAEMLLAVTMAHEATTFPRIAAVLLNGGFALSPDVTRLLDGIDSSLPVIRTALGTFDTALAVTRSRGLLALDEPARHEAAVRLFRDRVNAAELCQHAREYSGEVRTPTRFAFELFARAAAANAHIVLPEGTDDRVLRAAHLLTQQHTARLTILGLEPEVRERARELGLALDTVPVVDPLTSPLREVFAVEYARLRAHKGVTLETARERVTDVSYFGTMMVQLGYADGMVSGAAHTTAHTIRPSLEIVKTKPGVSVVSSVFFMALADRVLVYGDCAVNPDPTAEQLADIAISSAETAAQFGVDPRIAMLSYSTGTSGAGSDVDKVRRATELVRELRPELLVEGPIQYDAASDPATGHAKLPGSNVAGRATVFIFPDLNTGNNTYKAVQRSAGAVAVGPVLQGLKKPVNDLSRGALVEDIVNTVAVTAVQAGMAKEG